MGLLKKIAGHMSYADPTHERHRGVRLQYCVYGDNQAAISCSSVLESTPSVRVTYAPSDRSSAAHLLLPHRNLPPASRITRFKREWGLVPRRREVSGSEEPLQPPPPPPPHPGDPPFHFGRILVFGASPLRGEKSRGAENWCIRVFYHELHRTGRSASEF